MWSLRGVSFHWITGDFSVEYRVTTGSYQIPCQRLPEEDRLPLAVNVFLDNVWFLWLFSPPTKHKARVTFFQLFDSVAGRGFAMVTEVLGVTPWTSCCWADRNQTLLPQGRLIIAEPEKPGPNSQLLVSKDEKDLRNREFSHLWRVNKVAQDRKIWRESGTVSEVGTRN